MLRSVTICLPRESESKRAQAYTPKLSPLLFANLDLPERKVLIILIGTTLQSPEINVQVTGYVEFKIYTLNACQIRSGL